MVKAKARQFLFSVMASLLRTETYWLSQFIIKIYLRLSITSGKAPRVIYARKAVFSEEMEAITEELNLSAVVIHRDFLRIIIRHFFQIKTLHHLATENEVIAKTGLATTFQDYCARYFWPVIKAHGITHWVSCDFIYYYEKPFQQNALINNVGSVVFMKESFKSPIQHMGWKLYLNAHYKNAIPASAVGVANNAMKQVLCESKAISKEKIFVVGSPRMDREYNRLPSTPSAAKRARNTAIFFESGLTAGFPKFGASSEVTEALTLFDLDNFDYETVRHTWRDIHHRILKDSIEFALQNPDIQVIYKQKPSAKQPKIDGYTSVPDNWTNRQGGSNAEILSQAKFCVAFNTSAILEAMFRNIQIYAPHYSALSGSIFQPFLMNYGDGVRPYTDIHDLSHGSIFEDGLINDRQSPYDKLTSASTDGAFCVPVNWQNIDMVFRDN